MHAAVRRGRLTPLVLVATTGRPMEEAGPIQALRPEERCRLHLRFRVMHEHIVQRCAAMRCCLTAVRRYALLFDISQPLCLRARAG